MSKMYKELKDQGFNVLAFPCNQFGGQEPGTEAEIKKFVERYDVEFPMFSKIDVNGDDEHPVYSFMKKSFPGDVTWNFESKFLVDSKGIPVMRFGKKHEWDEIRAAIEGELKRDM